MANVDGMHPAVARVLDHWTRVEQLVELRLSNVSLYSISIATQCNCGGPILAGWAIGTSVDLKRCSRSDVVNVEPLIPTS